MPSVLLADVTPTHFRLARLNMLYQTLVVAELTAPTPVALLAAEPITVRPRKVDDAFVLTRSVLPLSPAPTV